MNFRSLFIERVKRGFHDINPDAPIVDDLVWGEALDDALPSLSEWRPASFLLELSITPGTFEYELPANFRDINADSFDAAVNLSGYDFVVGPGFYEISTQVPALSRSGGMLGALELYLPPYTDSSTPTFGMVFAPGTRFEFAQKLDPLTGLPGQVMFVSPTPGKTATLKFLYYANHVLTDDTGAGDDLVVGVNTVRTQDADLLVTLSCYHACQAMQRRTAQSKTLAVNFRRLAEQYWKRWEARTRNTIVVG